MITLFYEFWIIEFLDECVEAICTGCTMAVYISESPKERLVWLFCYISSMNSKISFLKEEKI